MVLGAAVPRGRAGEPTAAVLRSVPAVVEPVEALAASSGGVVTITAAGVQVLDSRGQRIRGSGTLMEAGAGGEPRGEARRWLERNNGGSWSSLDVPADRGWARSYDWEEIDDLDDPRLADEVEAEEGPAARGAAGRPRRPALRRVSAVDARPATATVAMAGRTAWVPGLAGSAGLLSIDLDAGATARVADQRLGRAHIRAVAAGQDGGTVAVAQGDSLFRSRDGGRTFDAMESAATVQRALAVTTDGTVLFLANGSEVWVLPAAATAARRLLLPEATDLASCGAQGLLLAWGELYGLFRGSAGTREATRRETAGLTMFRVASAPPGAVRIWCGDDGAPWVADGAYLSISVDQGVTWSRAAAPPGRITAVAVTHEVIWIGASSGLWQLSPLRKCHSAAVGRDSPPSTTTDLQGKDTLAQAFALARPPLAPSRSPWATLMPNVDLLFATARTASRHELRGLLVLTFSPSGRALVRSPERHAAQEAVRGRREAATRLFGLLAPSAGGGEDDQLAMEEAEAVRRIVREESQP